MRKVAVILIAALLAFNGHGQQNRYANEASDETKIEGTQLARLPYLIDVLKQLPKVTVIDDEVTVVGRGTPAIYIENRKVVDLSELTQIPASKVASIRVITQPGAEYGKDVQSVIEILTITEKKDGFRLSETLRLDLTHKLSTNNELRLGWKHNALILGTTLSYNESNSSYDKTTFKRHYDSNHQQVGEDEKLLRHIENYKQRLTGRFKASYQINDNHNLSANYSYLKVRKDRTYIHEAFTTENKPQSRHDIDLEYAGKIGAWDISIGSNTFIDDADLQSENPSSQGYYLRDEYDLRSYAKANTPLWKGNLMLGIEHEYDYMDVDKHNDSSVETEFLKRYGGIHAVNTDHTYAVFASTTQKFGKWTIEGGLRYERRTSRYKPCEDDGLMSYINYWVYEMDELRIDPTDESPISLLATNGELHTKRDYLYPTVKVSTKLGKSSLTLLHTQSSVRPYLGLTRLSIQDIEDKFVEDRILKTELIATTSLEWNYQWATLTATYTGYTNPICSTLDGTVKYNAPDYDALDLNATLTPKIGVWSPVLNMNMHKQWFDMPLANGGQKLHDTLFKLSFTNTISLPGNWLILVGANWHSKGGERNVYYYTNNLSVNASVQKEFPRPRLTLILSATNLMKDSYMDITRYTQSYRGLSEGAREREIRMVSFSLNFKI